MQGPFTRTTILASVLIAATVYPGGFALADHDMAREPLPTSWKADAELTDVFFLDANLGWAVGAQGVIVRTIDGGKTWNEISQVVELTANDLPLDQKIRNMRNGVRSRSTGIANNSSAHQPVRCRFESIHFVDEKYGWIAGGYDVPYVGRSRAVLMRTQDGGVTWEAVENLVVPRINRIHFSDPINGWAIGETGNLFQAGVFYTSDGGRSWSSQSSEKLKPWADGEQIGNGFVTLSKQGRIGVIKTGAYEASVIIQDDGSRITQLAMANGQRGWAVGENGTLIQTDNGGMSWSPVELPQVDNFIKAFDLETLSISGKKNLVRW